MRQHVAKLVPAFLVGGCSLIYNPSNIDKPMTDARMIDMGEVAVDVEIRADAMPRDLTIMEAFPTTIDEGSGTGGSRAAVVVLRGHNFVKDVAANLMVTITPATTGAAVLDSFEVSGNGDYIALAVSVPIDAACADGTNVAVGVTVKQNDLMGGDIMQTLDNAFAVRCLDELDAAPSTSDGLKALYSRIEISGPLDFPAATAAPALLRSASSITIGGALDASANGANPGPGGGIGGGVSGGGGGLRPGGGAAAGGGGGGGGAGFVVAGTAGAAGGLGGGGGLGTATGDPWLAKYAENSASGGGGGAAALTNAGGAGGGGGGTIELTAPGDITVDSVAVAGASGASASAGDGGAGTGGVVLVRAGNTLTLASVNVSKGAAVGNGGASSDGRVRIDAAKGAYPTGATTCVTPFSATCNLTQGPMFVDLPTRTTTQMHPIVLRGTANDATSTLIVYDKAGNPVMGPVTSIYTPTFGTTGQATVMPTLKAGYNKVCVWVAGGGVAVPESVNCREIAYLPL